MKKSTCGKMTLVFSDTDFGTELVIEGDGISSSIEYNEDEKTLFYVDQVEVDSMEIPPLMYNQLLILMEKDFTSQEVKDILSEITPIK